tara:strand:+ start:1463 stop:1972 length:510 start_codon:yes stop_codon:yes gene_type:complete
MKLKKNLILIGMMASGKSTIGHLLAKKLRLRFFDTDFIFEKKMKMKIAEFFHKRGEVKFRNLEKKIILNVLKKNNCVVSIGGGAFIDHEIRNIANKKHKAIWLNWTSDTLINRIKKNNKRPLALNLTNNELKKLIVDRSKIYSRAKYKIDCENMKKIEIVNKIIEVINQ